MAVDHYENFPVASVLLPRRMRAPVEAIYGFARGADDIADEGDGHWRVTCDSAHVFDVRDGLVAAKFEVVSAESTMVSSLTVEVTDAEDARKILRIIDALEDNDDVQDVYSNFDISDALMEQVGE